jgi:hypothetical protein
LLLLQLLAAFGAFTDRKPIWLLETTSEVQAAKMKENC